MGIVLGGVELYAGPVALGAPDDLGAVIRGFINEANEPTQVSCRSHMGCISGLRAA